MEAEKSRKVKALEKQIQALEDQASVIQKKKQSLEKRVENLKWTPPPVKITDYVKTMKDVIRIAKPKGDELMVLNYAGSSETLCLARDFAKISLISKVLNEGWKPKMDGSEDRYYPWFYLSSGFSFYGAHFDLSGAYAGSAARLCLKYRELAIHAAKFFEKEYKAAILSN